MPSWLATFRRRLLAWYARHQRTLPWRGTRDPYRVWVSEIMLQQTQVATVESYFPRFLSAFPTIQSLADAPEEQVLRLWEGLGYYRRARQLHAAAKCVVAEYRGVFPTDIEAVRKLPGIGRYTAGAILSIAFDQRQPILEANTFRLLARLQAYRGDPRSSDGAAQLWSFAEELLPQRDVGTFNQALMELGSLICKPRAPSCGMCPVAELCPTRAQGLQEEIPPPARKPTMESIHVAAAVIRRRNEVLLVRNPDGERWAGLWDFPRFELAGVSTSPTPERLAELVTERTGLTVQIERPLTTLKHGVTRFRITLDAWLGQPTGGRLRRSPWSPRWVKVSELDNLPLSVTGRKLVKVVSAL